MLTTQEFIEELREMGYRIKFYNNSIIIKEKVYIKNIEFSYWSTFAAAAIDGHDFLIYKETSKDFFNLLTHYSLTPLEERGEFNISLYKIPLKHLITTDGKQQYLTFKDGTYFASKFNKKLKQTFNEEELEHVPKFYRNLAVKIKD